MTETLEQQAAAAEYALCLGALPAIAEQLAGKHARLETTDDIADLLLPPTTGRDTYPPRWQLLEQSLDLQPLCTKHAEEILDTAQKVGLRQPQTLPDNDLRQVEPDAIIVAQGGARLAPITRWSVAQDVYYGAQVETSDLFDLASARPIPQFLETGRLNPEFLLAHTLTPDTLPTGDTTEHEVKLAAARQVGYSGLEVVVPHGVMAHLNAKGKVNRLIACPDVDGEEGLQAGLTLINDHFTFPGTTRTCGIQDRQVVIATSGHCRTSAALQAELWSINHDCPLGSVLTFGDEAGYATVHHDRQYITPDRHPVAYVPEIIIVYRLAQQIIEARNDAALRQAHTELPPGL